MRGRGTVRRSWAGQGAALVLAALALLLLVAGVPEQAAADPGSDPSEDAPACNEQRPLSFLVRGNYAYRKHLPPAERRSRSRLHQEAIRWRTERYGRVNGFGMPGWNTTPAVAYAEATRFMGMRVMLSRRIVPAVRCAEREIQAKCDTSYRPKYLSGYRSGNTFYGGEVSNHLFGIALDIDPEHNVCCKCLGPAAAHPVCARRDATLADRMAMPPCWVAAFERFGFYWLGRDELEDTMHLEFLGDPDRILREPRAGSDPR